MNTEAEWKSRALAAEAVMEMLAKRLEVVEAERDGRPEITDEEAYTWLGCRGGPTERSINLKLRKHGMRYLNRHVPPE